MLNTKTIHAELTKLLSSERVHTRLIDRVAYANDASYFRLIPQAVVQPVGAGEVARLFGFGQRHKVPLVFRAAGTSLSGQAVTDGILIDISKHWNRYEINKDARQIIFQPGIVGGFLNNVLKPHRQRIGPDPASIDAAMMGGILANNSSGMCCGVTENAYRTIASMRVVLPGGFQLDTGSVNATEQFRLGAPEIFNGLLELRKRLLAAPPDPDHPGESLAERVRRRYQSKNTNGYALNSFLDFDTPLDILTHLMIGSEGTLGFIAEATLNTLPELTRKYTGLLFFNNIHDAASAIFPLKNSGARALEILDRAALRSIEDLPGAPDAIRQLSSSSAAILVEYQAETSSDLAGLMQSCESTLSEIGFNREASIGADGKLFTEDPTLQASLWKLRKGIIPSVGALRHPGTTLLTEDIVFPVPVLADAITDLQVLFAKHGYLDAVIFGHAKDGNLHFLISQSFAASEEIRRFDSFTRDMVALVSGKYDGALKAEHGTGRNMAPFVATEWGNEAYGIMRDIKSLFDPSGTLAPGVIVNDDPSAHLVHAKSISLVSPVVDKCIECGFCEPKCPSRWLTLSPRQRIVVQREISRMQHNGSDFGELESLKADFQYGGIDTCALDGLCATACPVGINTGELIRRMRYESARESPGWVARWASSHFSAVEKSIGHVVSAGHAAAKVLGSSTLVSISKIPQSVLKRPFYKWNACLPSKSKALLHRPEKPDYIFFPSCISRQLGSPIPLKDGQTDSLMETFVKVAERAGLELAIPDDSEGVCCGMPFKSKGYQTEYNLTLHNALVKFWRWSDEGRIPIVIDTTSCLHTIRSCTENANELSDSDRDILARLLIIDSIELIHDHLLPKLTVNPLPGEVALHPNCSARKLGLDGKLVKIAQQCASSVVVPNRLGCCAFAGDRGLLFPELTESATREEAAEISEKSYAGYYSSNITCEIGMTSATGKTYLGIIYLVDKAS